MEKVVSLTGEVSLTKNLHSKLTEHPELDKLFQSGWKCKSIYPIAENYQGCWTVVIVLEK